MPCLKRMLAQPPLAEIEVALDRLVPFPGAAAGRGAELTDRYRPALVSGTITIFSGTSERGYRAMAGRRQRRS